MASRATQYRRVTAALVEQRQAPRHTVSVTQATVRQHGSEPSDAVLHDLSIYGCRLHWADAVETGERLWLRLAGGMPIAATAVWCRDGVVGCRFDVPIGSALVRALTRESEGAAVTPLA